MKTETMKQREKRKWILFLAAVLTLAARIRIHFLVSLCFSVSVFFVLSQNFPC